ncbi:MAG: glycosyltransferase family 39 protein [Gemmataceae bacterium]
MNAIAPSPTSIVDWIAQFWSTHLFGGPDRGADQAPRWSSLVLLVLLPGVMLYPCLVFPLFEPDESRYAQIPREMIERGDWILPTLQGLPYLDKPPLFYWSVALVYQVFGYHDWAARLVPAVAIHAALLLTYLLGRRTLGERAALLAGVLLALAPGFLGMGRLLLLDGLLTLMVTLALLAAFEAIRGEQFRWGWWLLAAVATGLGVLTKGPVALVLLLPPLWLYRRLASGGVRAHLGAWALFLAVVLALALPWYLLLIQRVPGFLNYFFWEHNLKRFLTPEMHPRGVWFYFPILWLLLLPGTLLLVPLVRHLCSLAPMTAEKRPPALGFHLLAGGWCVFFFTLSSGKLPTYIMPALPFFALVIGSFLIETGRENSRAVRSLGLAALGLMLFANYVALPWYARYRSPMSRPEDVLALCADRSLPVVCYPRNCDSIAFYLGRSDLRSYRSKDIEELRTLVRMQPRTVILCTHRHSLQGLKQLLPPEVRIVQERRMGLGDIPGVPPALMKPLARLMGETALGLADLAVIEMKHPEQLTQRPRP